MKLRIKGNSLRMRLTKSEVARIKNGEPVLEKVQFTSDTELSYCLEPSLAAATFQAHFENATVKILGPKAELAEWASGNAVSLTSHQEIGQAEPLFILVEKDFFCLKPRSHEVEDKSELFTNPNEAHGSCG